jgi:hypothetical protein
MRKLDPADGDGDEMFAFLADQLTFSEKPAQVFADSAFDDMPKTLVVFFDFQDHGLQTSPA